MYNAMKKLLFLIMMVTSINTVEAQCEGTHSAMEDDAWLSCQGTENPNPDRAQEHWIMYDFGDYYFLNESHFWNYNFDSSTSNGISSFSVDYSIDGVNWSWWGDYNLQEAPGSDFYYGEEGPDFNGLVTRYLLISVITNHGGNCYGFSEMQLQVDPGVIGIEEPLTQGFDFQVQPNPASDFAVIQLEGRMGSEINIFNSTGQLILSTESTSLSTRIDVSSYGPGVYLIEVIDTGGTRATRRLTVAN